MTSSVTQSWLRQNISSYAHPDQVYAHIIHLLTLFPTIKPKSDIYTFDDGRTQLLLCVHGLLPISFRNSSYNIPIAAWITRDYPKQPPMTYVVPTNDMLVKPGKFLDVSGRCNIDYLQHWQRKHEACSLSPLFQALQDHFSHEPPVYSKPSNKPPPTLLPSQSPPPLPPHPRSFRTEASQPSVPRGYTYPVPVPNIPVPPPPPPQPSHIHIPVQNLLDEDADSLSLVRPHIPFQPPPMRPPNPELVRLQEQVHRKLTSELTSLSQSLSLDAERLRAHQADLLLAEPAIKDEMARLQAVRDVCRNVANRTSQAIQQADSNMVDLKKKGDPEVDELVCATSIVHNQLINLVADDNAIEDTIYHLHRALNTGRIDLERFLRLTRVLAEEQFMKRALVDKIQSSVGRSTSNWA